MSARPKPSADDAHVEAERYIARHRDEIAGKLAAARAQVAAGQAEPLEPVEDLLREARRRRR